MTFCAIRCTFLIYCYELYVIFIAIMIYVIYCVQIIYKNPVYFDTKKKTYCFPIFFKFCPTMIVIFLFVSFYTKSPDENPRKFDAFSYKVMFDLTASARYEFSVNATRQNELTISL